MLHALVFILILGVGTAPSLAQVLRVKAQDTVIVSQSAQNPWVEGDEACVFQRKAKSACGTIVQAFGKVAVLKIERYEGITTRKTIRRTKENGTYVSMTFKNVMPQKGNKVRFKTKDHFNENRMALDEVVKNLELASGWPSALPPVERENPGASGWPSGVNKTRLAVSAKWGWPDGVEAFRPHPVDEKGWPSLSSTHVGNKGFFEPSELPEPGFFEKEVVRNYPYDREEKVLPRKEPSMGFSSHEFYSEQIEQGAVGDRDRQIAMNGYSKDIPTEMIEELSEDLINPYETKSSLSVGMNYINPFIHYQQSLTRHFGLGVSPSLLLYPSENAGLIKGFGAHLTFHYYGINALRGLWAQLGVGYYSVQASQAQQRETFGTVSSMVTLGYRFITSHSVSFALGAGVQYLSKSSPSTFAINAPNLLPSVLVEIGLVF